MDTLSPLELAKRLNDDLIQLARQVDLETIAMSRKSGQYCRIETSGDSALVHHLKTLRGLLEQIK